MINIFLGIFILFLGNNTYPARAADFFLTKKLAQHEFSLEKRYQDPYVNGVFEDNILLALNYLNGAKIDPENINWTSLHQPFIYKLVLSPGETFSFHEDVLPQYRGKIAKTGNSHFNSSEGFKSDGYLAGDGVCHLASLLYWVAKDAGLEALAPTRHDFAPIPEVPEEYGVSIFYLPEQSYTNEAQNLYITNNKEKEVVFEFKVEKEMLKINVSENLAVSQNQKTSGVDIKPVRWAAPVLGKSIDMKKVIGVPPGYVI